MSQAGTRSQYLERLRPIRLQLSSERIESIDQNLIDTEIRREREAMMDYAKAPVRFTPMPTTSPTNSCRTTVGTGMVFCFQASHL